MASLLQVLPDDLSHGRFSFSGRAGVDRDASRLHRGALFRPPQVQVGGRRVRAAREVGGADVLHLRAAFLSVLLTLHLRLVEAMVLGPAGDLADLLGGQEAAAVLRADGAVEGLGSRVEEPLHQLTLLLTVEELRRELVHRQEHCILVQALLLGVRHDRRPACPRDTVQNSPTTDSCCLAARLTPDSSPVALLPS